ncbi:MAG: YbhB/YbcL family Raf kinase inhibitor-like protein [Chlamydiae bacterium]|nr:YbhB/YbcL family Raf kinase inhibitor-like protein [Chlamydiota bacterium]
MTNFSLSSPDFNQKDLIPKEYTCVGKNISPKLLWENPPKNTKSFALAIVDPDAPSGDFIHWVIYNIPASANSLVQGVPTESSLENKAMQGLNDFGRIGYGGPCPPKSEKHSYVFTLYALDTMLSLKPKAAYDDLQKAMEGHILGESELIGYFAK